MARTLNEGKGGQCQRPKNQGGDFCNLHTKQNDSPGGLAHGRVDGPIPAKKLEEFQRFAKNAEARGAAENKPDKAMKRAMKEAAGQEEAPKKAMKAAPEEAPKKAMKAAREKAPMKAMKAPMK